jgi:hypothetical protein
MNWTNVGKGLRTLAVGLAIAIAPSALAYIGGIDWTQFGVSPAAGAFIGIVVMGMRTVTTTPVGKSS